MGSKVGTYYLCTSLGSAWWPVQKVLHSILPTHLEILGPAAHRVVSSLSLEGRKQNLGGQVTAL